MPEVKILSRTDFADFSKGPAGTPSVMILFQLADLRQGAVKLLKIQEKTPAEDQAIRDEIARMGKPVGEYRFV